MSRQLTQEPFPPAGVETLDPAVELALNVSSASEATWSRSNG